MSPSLRAFWESHRGQRLRHRSVCRVGGHPVPPPPHTHHKGKLSAPRCGATSQGPPLHVCDPLRLHRSAVVSEPPSPGHSSKEAGAEASRLEAATAAVPSLTPFQYTFRRVHLWGLRNQSGEEAERQDRGTTKAPPKRTGAYHGIKPNPLRARGRPGRD